MNIIPKDFKIKTVDELYKDGVRPDELALGFYMRKVTELEYENTNLLVELKFLQDEVEALDDELRNIKTQNEELCWRLSEVE